jgi:hypothetical protein
LTGAASSKAGVPAIRRPSIDDLVATARNAGYEQATRRTIRYWVERRLVDGAKQLGRDPRYPLRTIGQVDTLAHLPLKEHGLDLVRFALFIETGSGSAAEALRTTAARIAPNRESAAAARKAAAEDPELLRAEVKRAARMRAGNSVLPRAVRMSQDERDQAVGQLVQAGLRVQIDGIPAGMDAVERALGLRSGHGGRTRETPLALSEKDLEVLDSDATYEAVQTATLCHARVARNVTELFCVWFPALIPGLVMASTSTESKLLQIVHGRSDKLDPEAYLATFAGFLARIRAAPDETLAEMETALQPDRAMVEMLAEHPPSDLEGVLARLRPLQRLKLEVLLARATATDRPRKTAVRMTVVGRLL